MFNASFQTPNPLEPAVERALVAAAAEQGLRSRTGSSGTIRRSSGSFSSANRRDDPRLRSGSLSSNAPLVRRNPNKVSDLFAAVRDETDEYQRNQENRRPSEATVSLSGDADPGSSQFYEVLYLGKIKVSHKRAPPTFIDDALAKFKAHENHKPRRREDHDPPKPKFTLFDGEPVAVRPPDAPLDGREAPLIAVQPPTPVKTRALSPADSHPLDVQTPGREGRTRNNSGGAEDPKITMSEPPRGRAFSTSALAGIRSNKSSFQSFKASQLHRGETGNRTMLLQVAKTELRLISPDRRIVLLHKAFREVSHVARGQSNPDHFGFICRDHDSFVGFVFQCQCSSVVDEIMLGLKTAFHHAHAQQRRERNQTCEACPMQWFHNLCRDLEGTTTNKAQQVVLKRIDTMPDEERRELLTKFRGAETSSIQEQNEILMMLLRAHCEIKQQSHVHTEDPTKSDFLNDVGGSLLRAKRSLTLSFSDMMKRKEVVTRPDRPAPEALNPLTPDKRNQFQCGDVSYTPEMRQRANTIGVTDRVQRKQEEAKDPSTSPMMSIFMRSVSGSGSSHSIEQTVPPSSSTPTRKKSSVRREIFESVMTPSKDGRKKSHHDSSPFRSPVLSQSQQVKKRRTRKEYRFLWKKAIMQQILLIRMERENRRIIASQEEAEERRQKLQYTDLASTDGESVGKQWDPLLGNRLHSKQRIDRFILLEAVRTGVPKVRRGEIWSLLAQQQELRTPDPMLEDESDKFENFDVPYELLKTQLTAHQHAILIDLGRTFPAHPYFGASLGPGQLSLYNLLKAYSILDTEVGYCQGLSFVAGVLLMHTTEEEAFTLLKHIMFGLGLRRQYKPDMTGLQVQMYQLSRLVHDVQRDLFDHLQQLEVDPSLYATPWFLTVFSAHFPLGFVVRVFDLLLLEGSEAIFKVALALLSATKPMILQCDSIDDLMVFLKDGLVQVGSQMLEEVIQQAFSLSISKQLHAYEVEYHVLQEEMHFSGGGFNGGVANGGVASPGQIAKELESLKEANEKLRNQNQDLLEQLQNSRKTIQSLQSDLSDRTSMRDALESERLAMRGILADLLKYVPACDLPKNVLNRLENFRNGNAEFDAEEDDVFVHNRQCSPIPENKDTEG